VSKHVGFDSGGYELLGLILVGGEEWVNMQEINLMTAETCARLKRELKRAEEQKRKRLGLEIRLL